MSATIHHLPAVRDHLNGVAVLARRTVALDRELVAAKVRIAEFEARLERVDGDLTEVLNALVATGALSVEALRA